MILENMLKALRNVEGLTEKATEQNAHLRKLREELTVILQEKEANKNKVAKLTSRTRELEKRLKNTQTVQELTAENEALKERLEAANETAAHYRNEMQKLKTIIYEKNIPHLSDGHGDTYSWVQERKNMQ
jgi:chromosome segregation ATPase